jgi:hypothetical protein
VIELGFTVNGYPGTGRKVEKDRNLAQVSRPDLIQGAFMGDAIFKLEGADFSTHFGWVTLLDWCLRLTAAFKDLELRDSTRFEFAESDDYVEFVRNATDLQVTCSYQSGVATVRFEDLKSAVHKFVDDRLGWVARKFPSAMRNPSMPDIYFRLDRSFPLDSA